MNRREKRAAKAIARKSGKSAAPKIEAIHEAAHAVARVLAAGELGWSLNEAVTEIQMGSGTISRGFDGKTLMREQGVTFGRTFSREIDAAADEFMKAYLSEHGTLAGAEAFEFMSKIVERARNASVDVSKWFRMRVFLTVAASIAEAIVSRRSFNKVWDATEAESDRFSIERDAVISGVEGGEVQHAIEQMAVLAAFLMEQPDVWTAVTALARKLPVVGTMDGATAVEIVIQALGTSDPGSVFTQALEELAGFERDIRDGKIVVARAADGSTRVIKGAALISDAVGTQFLQFNITHHVLAETLWLAFGDGALPATPNES